MNISTERLVYMLERIDLPGIELASHQQNLKRTLLDSYKLQQPTSGSGILFLLFKPFNGLSSQQPVWKTLFISSIAWILIAVIIMFVFFAPISNKGMNTAMAADLVLNNQQIKAILPADGTTTVTISDMGIHKMGIFIQKHGVYVNAELDTLGNLKIKKITYYNFLSPQQGSNALTVEENEKALKFAKGDSRVQSLQNTGFIIQSIEAVYCNAVTNNIDAAKVTNIKQMFAFLVLESGNEQKGFLINLETGLVLSR